MRTVFADTFYFIAQLNPADEAHQAAKGFLASFNGNLITTDWVLAEVADAFSRPPNRGRFIDFYRMLPAMPDITMALTGDHHFEQAGFVALLT